jgi:hypothetical protein
MTTLAETPGGSVQQIDDSTWIVVNGPDVSRHYSPGDALNALSQRCEVLSGAGTYAVDYVAPIEDLHEMVAEAGGTELFPSSDDGWLLINGWWLPSCVQVGYGDAETVADLVDSYGDMGVHVDLFEYCGIYFVRWVVVDRDDEGVEVFGDISHDEAIRRASEIAIERGDSNGLTLPYALGLANLRDQPATLVPEDAELVAHASTAWPYDTSVEEAVSIFRHTHDGITNWLVTTKGDTTVLGRYESWPALDEASSTHDGWEIIVDWLVDEPEGST